jgi:hypothetical protein
MILACLTLLSTLSTFPPQTAGTKAPAEAPRPVELVLEPRDGSGLLAIQNPSLPGETFTFVSCEALFQSNKTSTLYPISLAPKDWKNENGRWSYTWEFEDKLRLDFSATPESDSVLLKYTLTNGSADTLKRVTIFPCLPSRGAPAFYPGTPEEAREDTSGRKARVGRHDYSELYARLSLFSNDKRFTFTDSPLSAAEKHLAFMKTGEPPLVWSWFINAERTFDVPLVVESSRDHQHAIALTFDHGVQISSNVGDGRACIHVVPMFEEIGAGKSATTVGRFYWVKGEEEGVLERYRKDFPKVSAH